MIDDHERTVLAGCEEQLAREDPHLRDHLRRHSWTAARRPRVRRALPGWVASSILVVGLMTLLALPSLVPSAAPPVPAAATSSCGPPSPGPPDRCATVPSSDAAADLRSVSDRR